MAGYLTSKKQNAFPQIMSDENQRGLGREKKQKPFYLKGKNYLLAIGIDNYEHCPKLFNAVSDAKSFVKLLTEKYQFESGNIAEIYNEEATRKNIIQALDKMVDKVTPEDNLLIYFSGHGEYDERLDEGYWIPVTAEVGAIDYYISNSSIIKFIKAIKSHHTLMIVDSCFSGSLFAERSLGGEKRQENIPSRWMLTSGRKEPVSDGKPGDSSPFAENILYFLKENVTSGLAIGRLIDDVINATASNAKQIPRGEPLQDVGHKGGQFFFHLKKNEPADWALAKETNTIAGYHHYLDKYPDGKHIKEANVIIEELQEERLWVKVREENSIQAYYNYRQEYPNGKYIEKAVESIAVLEEDEIWASAKKRNIISGYDDYLAKYPEGKYVKEANSLVTSLLAQSGDLVKPVERRDTTETDDPAPVRTVVKEVDNSKKWKYIIGGVLAGIVLIFGLIRFFGFHPDHDDHGAAGNNGKLFMDVQQLEDKLDIEMKGGEPPYCLKLYRGSVVIISEEKIRRSTFEIPTKKFKDQPGTYRLELMDNKKEYLNENIVIRPGNSSQPNPDRPQPKQIYPETVFIRGGEFKMGCTAKQSGFCKDSEKPVHKVKVASFNIGKYEITNEEYALFLNSVKTHKKSGFTFIDIDSELCRIKKSGNIYTVKSGYERHPVTWVSWHGAQAYCSWLTEKTGTKYQLPSESQWEFVARGASKERPSRYSGGDYIDGLAWFDKNGNKDTHPVGKKRPNEIGVHDLSGNVFEWCRDYYDSYFYKKKSKNKITENKTASPTRSLRGGSYFNKEDFARVTFRTGEKPELMDQHIGFRVVSAVK